MNIRKSAMTLITPKALAVRLDMSTSTLAKWRLDGAGPAYVKIGARVAYDEEMVEAWLASRVRKSTSDTGMAAA